MNIKYLIVHHTASIATPGSQQIHGVDRFHRDKDWGGGARAKKSKLGFFVQYHYFIEENGELIQTAEEDELRWHAGYMNSQALGICMAGEFDSQLPTEAQIATLRALLLRLTAKYALNPNNVVPHRKFAQKTCYGSRLADDWAERLLTPAPVPVPPGAYMFKQQILVLTSHLENLDLYKTGIQKHIEKVPVRTNNEFAMEVTYYETPATFHTKVGTNTTGDRIVFVDPMEIAIEGRKAEVALGKEFDIVCLIYDNTLVIGEQPTNPMQAPITVEGFNPIQIPENWLGHDTTSVDGWYGAELFFGHECSHSDVYQVNSKNMLAIRDRTHDINPYSQYTPIQVPNQSDFFIDILIELKQWWPSLVSGSASQEMTHMINRTEPVKVFSLKINGAIFVCKLIGGRQIVGEGASDPNDLNGLEDNFGIELVNAAGQVITPDASFNLPA